MRSARAAERLDLRLRVAEDLRRVGREPRPTDAATSGVHVRLGGGIRRREADPSRQAALDGDGHADLAVGVRRARRASSSGASSTRHGHRRRPPAAVTAGHLLLDAGELGDARDERLELEAREDVAHRLRVHRLHLEVGGRRPAARRRAAGG